MITDTSIEFKFFMNYDSGDAGQMRIQARWWRKLGGPGKWGKLGKDLGRGKKLGI